MTPWLLRAALRPLRTRPGAQRADVLVVLGAALTHDGGLGPVLAERVAAGVAAFHAGLAPLLLVTGAREATAMKRHAVAAGVATSAVLVEHAALTTRDNAVGCAAIMRAHGLGRALIVTQAFHRRRAVTAFRRAGVEAEALEFAAERESLHAALREYVALAAYAVRGWI